MKHFLIGAGRLLFIFSAMCALHDFRWFYAGALYAALILALTTSPPESR